MRKTHRKNQYGQLLINTVHWDYFTDISYSRLGYILHGTEVMFSF